LPLKRCFNDESECPWASTLGSRTCHCPKICIR
jgi:hypothetical protein